MIDRKNQPAIHSIDSIHFEKPLIFDITKNNRLFCLTDVQNETSKFELAFDAGSILGDKNCAAIVNDLLLSGTKEKTSTQISAEIDGLGGFVEHSLSIEGASFSIYSLRENLIPIARIVKDAIENCQFFPHEVEQALNVHKQRLEVSLEKVGVLAQRSFKQRFFNSSEEYSRVATSEDFDSIKRSDLVHFHHENYINGLKNMALVGNFSQTEIDAFIDVFGSWASEGKSEFKSNFENIKGYSHIEKEDSLQTAIRIGCHLFNKKHKDYADFLVLNTIIGGYFGSRLMQNIREEKGYTYGVGSMASELHKTGYFMIGTEVKKEVKDLALAEIKYELDKLKQKEVSEEELGLVKNYMLGQLLKSADGPYSMMDLYLEVEDFGLSLDYYNQLIKSIHAITPERIKELANKYLDWNEFTIVTAG